MNNKRIIQEFGYDCQTLSDYIGVLPKGKAELHIGDFSVRYGKFHALIEEGQTIEDAVVAIVVAYLKHRRDKVAMLGSLANRLQVLVDTKPQTNETKGLIESIKLEIEKTYKDFVSV